MSPLPRPPGIMRQAEAMAELVSKGDRSIECFSQLTFDHIASFVAVFTRRQLPLHKVEHAAICISLELNSRTVDSKPLQAGVVEVTHVIDDPTEPIMPLGQRVPITRMEVDHSNDAIGLFRAAMEIIDIARRRPDERE